MRKYKYTGRTMKVGRKTYREIVAVRDFGGVKAGEVGGYIQHSWNLSHRGNAWVALNATVGEFACVTGDALVTESARVDGCARVAGRACIWGKAWVSDTAKVDGSASVGGDARIWETAHIKGNADVRGDAYFRGLTISDGFYNQ